MLPLDKWLSDLHFFFYKVTFFPPPGFCFKSSVSRKDILHPKLEQTQPGPTSSAIIRSCYFPSPFGQSAHISHATRSSSCGPQ